GGAAGGAGTRDGERERSRTAVRLRLVRVGGRDREGGVVVPDGLGGAGGGELGAGRVGTGERDGEGFVGRDMGVAGVHDDDRLRRVARVEGHGAGGQDPAGEVGGVGGRGAAAGDRVIHRGRARGVAAARDGEGERRGAAAPLGLVRVGGHNREAGVVVPD